MDSSLSVILPVHNGESWLAEQVVELLDLLADMTPQFEVLIIDDGSTDQTEEVAHELCRNYPQLRVCHHETRRGSDGALKTGIQHTQGDVLMICDGQAPISATEIRRLWNMRNRQGLIEAHADPQPVATRHHTIRRVDQPSGPSANFADRPSGGIRMVVRSHAARLGTP